MMTIGLTGSIGMGKSTTAAMFAEEGVPVYDADAEVHKIYARGGAAVAPLEEAFPGVVRDGAVHRPTLSARVVGDAAALDRLNRIVHPLLGAGRAAFFAAAAESGADMVLLDIPLLFETGGERNMDAVVVASAPADVQRARVLAREDMTEVKLDAILARQMADEEKRVRAHYVVDTQHGLDHARDQVRAIIADLRAHGPHPRGVEAASEAGQ